MAPLPIVFLRQCNLGHFFYTYLKAIAFFLLTFSWDQKIMHFKLWQQDLETKWGMPTKFLNNTIKLQARKLGTLHERELICSHVLNASKHQDFVYICLQPGR